MEPRLHTVAEVTVAINEELMDYEAARKKLLKTHQLRRSHLRNLRKSLEDIEAAKAD